MTPQALKASILQLAIQGKLVPQRPEEGTAEDLYQQIQAEKQRLIAEGTIKREKALAPIKEDEIPFEIPETWKWVYIGEVFAHNTGKAQNASAETKNGVLRKFITTSNLYWDSFDFTTVKEMLFSESELTKCSVQKGDLLVCEGGDVGRSAIWPYEESMCIQNHIHKLRAYVEIEPRFFYYVLYLWKNTGNLSGRGVGIKGLSSGALHAILCPLPPLAEQKRIVAKIEEMLPLVERYGEAYEQLQAFNKRFPDDLRKSILQEAIQGKLVPQRPEEGTAEDLYQEIQEEKRRLIAESSIKKEKPLPPIEEKDIPFDIPETWKWVRLGDCISLQSGQDLQPQQYNNQQKGIPYITGASNIDEGDVLINRWTKEPKSYAHKGDLLISCKGTIGKMAILAEEKVHIARQIMGIKPIIASTQYIQFFLELKIPTYKEAAKSFIPGIERNTILTTLIPLPPLAEQMRIVTKIEEMLKHCSML